MSCRMVGAKGKYIHESPKFGSFCWLVVHLDKEVFM